VVTRNAPLIAASPASVVRSWDNTSRADNRRARERKIGWYISGLRRGNERGLRTGQESKVVVVQGKVTRVGIGG